MAAGFGYSAFKLAYQVSPLILVDGVVAQIPGGMLPIVAITEAASFVLGILHGQVSTSLDDFFAQFQVLPGGSLVNNEWGMYPFANQAVAANAIIAQPLNVSLAMVVPVRKAAGYTGKLATMSALKATLDAHNQAGGTYALATPSYVYTGLIMTGLRDVSHAGSKQVQWMWQMDFVKPLVSQADAATALNSLMNKLSAGLPSGSDPVGWSGLAPAVGSQQGLVGPSVLPSAQDLTGSATNVGYGSPVGQVFGP